MTNVEIYDYLVNSWGESGDTVYHLARKTAKPMYMKEFLDHCIACGGDWGQMLLTGIHALFPEVYDAIPDDMGLFAWGALCITLRACGVTPDEEKGE